MVLQSRKLMDARADESGKSASDRGVRLSHWLPPGRRLMSGRATAGASHASADRPARVLRGARVARQRSPIPQRRRGAIRIIREIRRRGELITRAGLVDAALRGERRERLTNAGGAQAARLP